MTWAMDRPRARRGDVVGSPDDGGYLGVHIDGATHRLHRLIWLWMTGEQPEVIDHIDQDGRNNRWANLRNVDHRANVHNTDAIQTNNRSGRRGVHRHSRGKKWAAQITADGQHRHLGLFDTIDDASAAYEAARHELHTGRPQ